MRASDWRFLARRWVIGYWVGVCGLHLQPLVDTLKVEMLGSTVLQADEIPMQMLKLGAGETQRAYPWSYTPMSYDSLRAVATTSPLAVPGGTAAPSCKAGGKLVTDDYAGYKAGFAAGITELGCMAHARKLHPVEAQRLQAQPADNHRWLHEIGQCSPQLASLVQTHEAEERTLSVSADDNGPLALFAAADTVKETCKLQLHCAS